jgi:energy-coupling factor transporter ATP-binding protein EcfA2
MRITRVCVDGFKRFTAFALELDPTYNVIVGDNEAGKSSLLEAIGLVLTGQYDGRLIQYGIDPYLFNAPAVAQYFANQRRGLPSPPPRIEIEAYLQASTENPAVERLRGSNNSKGEDGPGLVITIEVEAGLSEALREYAADASNPTVLPVEFYRVTWRSFSGETVTIRRLPFRVATIDTGRPRLSRGPNKYLAQIVDDVLSDSQRRDLSLEYKRLQHKFSQEPGVIALNAHLASTDSDATRKKLSIQMDLSSRTSWDSAITAHLDDLPFDCAGKGEQCRMQVRLAMTDAAQAQVLLIEEPENHLSHSHLAMLMDDIRTRRSERQVVITTHSAFVLNKLGLDKLHLLSISGHSARLSGLDPDTTGYFLRLPGYDTLRLILSKRSILVEGPSDELIVQRAYRDKHGKLPLEDGVDVISVGALAFKRFLEIGALLKLDVCVLTDNDGDPRAVKEKYSLFITEANPTLRVFCDDDGTCPTLEPQLLKANSLAFLNTIFGTTHSDAASLLTFMKRHKTDCALKMFATDKQWTAPTYIGNAL